MPVPGGKKLEAASPCTVSWESMSGDARARHCALCQKQVFNFSGLTQAEVDAVMHAKSDEKCWTYYERPDGTMMTSDCPVGLLGVPARWAPPTTLGILAWVTAFLFAGSVVGVQIFGDNIRKLFGAPTCTLYSDNRPQVGVAARDVEYHRSTAPRRDPFAAPEGAAPFQRDPFAAPTEPVGPSHSRPSRGRP